MTFEMMENRDEYMKLLNTPIIPSPRTSRESKLTKEMNENAPLISKARSDVYSGSTRLHRILKQFFLRYDTDNSGCLDIQELCKCLYDVYIIIISFCI